MSVRTVKSLTNFFKIFYIELFRPRTLNLKRWDLKLLL